MASIETTAVTGPAHVEPFQDKQHMVEEMAIKPALPVKTQQNAARRKRPGIEQPAAVVWRRTKGDRGITAGSDRAGAARSRLTRVAVDNIGRRLTGTTISRYRIRRELGFGGMGVVYEATDLLSGRPVALKFVSGASRRNQAALQCLIREATLLATLQHPNICSGFGFEQHAGHTFMVMERLEGLPLSTYLNRHLLSTADIVQIALQIASALQFLHEKGVVHRDIKTANLFVCRDGVVKLVDFGLARHFASARAEGEGSGSADEAEVLGTANYVAPERLLKLPADPRSDLFSLGVVMYEMAARRLPFAGESTAETVFNVLTEEPPPLSAIPIPRPRWFVRVVRKLLEKKMRHRYQSAAAVRVALNLRGSPVRRLAEARLTEKRADGLDGSGRERPSPDAGAPAGLVALLESRRSPGPVELRRGAQPWAPRVSKAGPGHDAAAAQQAAV